MSSRSGLAAPRSSCRAAPRFSTSRARRTPRLRGGKNLGTALVRSAAPDSEESRIARYWPGGGGNHNAITRAIVAGLDLDRWQNARLFALINMADHRRHDRHVPGQVHLQLLASLHRDPLDRRRQPHTSPTRTGPRISPRRLSGLHLRPADRRRLRSPACCASTSAPTNCPTRSPPPPLAWIPQLQHPLAGLRRSGLRPRLRRHPLPHRLRRMAGARRRRSRITSTPRSSVPLK